MVLYVSPPSMGGTWAELSDPSGTVAGMTTAHGAQEAPTGPETAEWAQFHVEAPELAAKLEKAFTASKHLTVATIRKDGAPRICGTEIILAGGRLYLGGMTGNRRFQDLRRDPRLALHSACAPPEAWEDPAVMARDAKISGIAVEVLDPAEYAEIAPHADGDPPEPFELFRVDLTDATVIGLTDSRDALLIETWRPGAGVTRHVRS